MASDSLAVLVQRALGDPDFRGRALSDLEGTLAAEGITLEPAELEAVRQLQAQMAGLPREEADSRLVGALRRQGPML